MSTEETLKLGIIGLSSGNGHPYSWSAIFNGYDPEEMARCPFPSIPEYLGKRSFPEDAIADAEVTHVWCDSEDAAQSVSKCSLVGNICHSLEELVDSVDAILLARDDAENNLRLNLKP